MKLTNVILTASAAGLVSAYPRVKPAVPSDQSIAKKRANGFKWVGVSESGAEFGETNIPGTLDKDYTWPDTSKVQVLRDAGMNVFRIPFLMERLVPDSLTGTPDSTYLSDLQSTVKFVTDSGAYAVIDPHNYGRYNGNIISSTDNFKAFWKTVATEFANNEKVIFDTNNEYHDMDQTLVLNLNQAAIDGIRAAGATSQYIFAEGNAYSGAWSWTDNNDNLKDLTDPQDKLIYEMHQYLDSDSSGTSETCVSTTIGQERLESATQWLKTNNKKAFLGEFAGGVNSDCETAVQGLLSYLSDNSDVWTGATWWAAGPWWGTYMYSLEPTDGPAYSTYLPILEKYFVDGSGSTSSAAQSSAASSQGTTPTSSLQVTSTPNSQAQAPSPIDSSSSASVTSFAVPTSQPVSFTSISVFVPTPLSSTTFASSSSSAVPSSTISVSASPSTSGGAVRQYNQCGGLNWTGPTSCQAPYSCKIQNPYYSQCL